MYSMKMIKTLSALSATFGLLSVLGCASTPTQGSAGEYIDDSVITTKVKTAIVNDPDLRVLEINVVTTKGVVQLSGFVNSGAAERQAVELARGVQGVKSVKDDMRTK